MIHQLWPGNKLAVVTKPSRRRTEVEAEYFENLIETAEQSKLIGMKTSRAEVKFPYNSILNYAYSFILSLRIIYGHHALLQTVRLVK